MCYPYRFATDNTIAGMPENQLHIDTWNTLLHGDPSSLEQLYNQHYIGLLNYGIKLTHQRELAKDSIFQLFLRLWDNRSKLPPLKNVRSYLITCLHRDLLAHIKKDSGKVVNLSTWDELYPNTEFSYEDHLIQVQQQQEVKTKVKLAFAKLSAREQELLQLKFFEDLDYDAIASTCNITKRTAYNIIYGALKTLKQTLSAETSTGSKNSLLLHTLKSLFF